MKFKLSDIKNSKNIFMISRLVAVIFLLFIGFSTKSNGISQTFFFLAYFITAFEGMYKTFMAFYQKSLVNDDTVFFLICMLSLMLGIGNAALIVNIYYYSVLCQKAILKYHRDMYSFAPDNNIEHVNVLSKLGSMSVTSPENINKGDIIHVNPGEYILTDGFVVDGASNVSAENVTGDLTPLGIGINDTVMAGYVNLSSPFTYKSYGTIFNTHFNKEKDIANKVLSENGKGWKKVRKYMGFLRLGTVIITLAALCAVLFTDFEVEYAAVLAVLAGTETIKNFIDYIVFNSVYSAAKQGIMYKNVKSVSDISNASTAVFEFKNEIGDFVVESVEVYDEYSENNLKDIASAVYSKSSLPFANAICKYAGFMNASSKISELREIDHSGCFAYLDGHQIVSGTTEFMKKSKIHIPYIANESFAGVHFAVDGVYIGNIHFKCNEFYMLSEAIAKMKCDGLRHFVVFGVEDEAGISRVRNILKADYFPITEDRGKIINDIIDNVNGKIILFGWHDWMVTGVTSVYLGSGRIDDEYTDSDVVVAGKSVSASAVITGISAMAEKYIRLSFVAFSLFKILIAVFMLIGMTSVYFTLITEFLLYTALSFFVSYRYKLNK